ncbi:cleavage and polyadenylation specificity factor 3, isoform CRA_b [Thamnocephalis sphaerospora]|uniref:Endoribonuclease YSH1 n=1 Tax=Thamnocephalis sphaerospora TaxID=78915 RepID=A0A4P9XWD8_9FUNG|nr:cleavage and polyadenylation specificity factor 3, isoform CRA_b [Thamnocephalis sphaerospora]|eukprot:RKP09911.1 cleavage and polyadenylation specificity factor 3, isoform CRA_b [Thamnocephalis sphaerospora]
MEIPAVDDADVLQITALGAGNEVGRSCLVVQYKGKTVMLDVGIHPAYDGIAGLPFFDEVDLSTIDVCLVTHFHLDHAAGLPYLMEKTDFQGQVFMTHATKVIYKWMLTDYVKVSNVSREDMLFDEQELLQSYDKIQTIDFRQENEVEGIKFTAYNAGHVLGAAMFLLEIAGVKILYTGDYSREEDRHLMAAERPPGITPDVLICESTYGVQSHEPRLEREARFTTLVHDIVRRGGRCLMPVFALGRAQELLLILDEYWSTHPELDAIPIYYASSLAKKCMAVYQTFINTMNERIRKQFAVSNPFVFKHISNLRNMDNFDDNGPCVMMASPGMLQSGLSRELLERWCPDPRNGLIITGYSVDGTMAKHITSEPEEIQSTAGAKLPVRMSVDYISFSAHVDFTQNSQFIEEVNAPNLVLVHGDSNAMHRLRNAMESRYKEREQPINIYTPRNCETVRLHFRGEKKAKMVGNIAERMPTDGQLVSGVVVAKDFQYSIMAPTDLVEFSDLATSTIQQRMSVPCSAPLNLVRHQLQQMYGALTEIELKPEPTDATSEKEAVMNAVDIVPLADQHAIALEWSSSPLNDMIADSVVALLLSAETNPSSVKRE